MTHPIRTPCCCLALTATLWSCAQPSQRPPAPDPVSLPRPAPAEAALASGVSLTARPAGVAVVHPLTYPTRLAVGADGRLYVTDARQGSVFVLDADRQLVAELAGLGHPLGIAVDAAGRIYVGRPDRRSVEVLSATGAHLATFGEGQIQMPNDLVLDAAGNLYVADSRAHEVKVYGPDGLLRLTLGGLGDGDGSFRFPSALALADGQDGELFVADQGHARIQVFDLQGQFLRAFGQAVPAFTEDWQGRFVKVQSLALDALGRLHVADTGLSRIQVLDPLTGVMLAAYGGPGSGPEALNLPLDLVLLASGAAVVADAGNRRLTVIPPEVIAAGAQE